MTRRRYLVVLIAAWCAGASGCNTAPPELKAIRTVPFVLDATKKTTAVTAHVAEEIKLTLPPIAEPGFQWQLFAHDTRFLKQTSEVTLPTDPGISAVVTFLVLRPAARPTRIRFFLVGEKRAKESRPVDTHEVLVSIK